MDDRVKKFLDDAKTAERSADPLSGLLGLQESVNGVQDAIQEMLSQEFVGSDSRELVSATVKTDGLKAVSIGPRAMRDLDSEQLASACLEAIRNARQKLVTGMRGQMRVLSDAAIPDEGQLGGGQTVEQIFENLKRF